ncbi:MAG TPA: heparan-alpha-glucosaminide N-acetyltransferase domain-containing protein, partial [Gemmatimonadaceae bacterium]|nr:heparan-alpha-glucosaminide N-acetyltransferase domain-containing protein [Gemmatimonadaceae bacterium]
MSPQAASVTSRDRIASVDIIRGAVMVLMAIDHVRVFAGVPTNGPPGVFFTRWVTHFCAPAFIFLAGTAAFLYGQKVGARSSLAKFLVIRGLWLVLLELTLLRFGWTFNFDYANFTFAGVIWVIGWSMVVLAILVFLPVRIVGAIGVAIILLHNGLAPVLSGGENPSPVMQVLYAGGNFGLAGLNIVVLYVLLPWAGVMAAGFAFGAVLREPPERRRRICITIGLAAIVLFIMLRATGIYGDPREWSSGNGPLAFLNPAKYPPSLQFLLMTLGPTILLIPFLENVRGRVARWLRIFGQVPFFFYVLHIPLIHLSALLISMVRTPESTGWLVANHPMLPPDVPEGYRWSLGLLYLVWAIVVAILYFACRWYAEVKA